MSNNPPPYTGIPTLYDETHHGKWYMQPEVASMGNLANLMGYLEHHGPHTDGSFAITVAGGNVTLVSKKLYESIPEQHRPPLDTTANVQTVSFLMGSPQQALGSTIMPVVLTNATTGRKFCIKLYALVMENLLMGMFIGRGDKTIFARSIWEDGQVTYLLQLGNEEIPVVHRLQR
ncbi:hypothetical protein AAF712_012553 [Marasmius tenuissimus]|uniref:Uncharacterized protein n=1 Tax=Marasmius tenuissimus TaxID=585030 RepID=A0ABR2ZI78_9AGAR|nr:hypothetical protein PM082_008485 [Marasmius tenuissimus]